MKRNVAILIFNDAEVLDFAGPFEVFSVTCELNDYTLFNVFTVSKSTDIIRAVNGLSVKPDYAFDNHPPIDILIIAGGSGTRNMIKDQEVLSWVASVHPGAEKVLSICSGSRLLGVIGLLDHKPYCTHHEVYEHMKELVPTGIPQPEKRFVKSDDKIYTSGGITAGIDLCFHVIKELYGVETAQKTSTYMEYTVQW